MNAPHQAITKRETQGQTCPEAQDAVSAPNARKYISGGCLGAACLNLRFDHFHGIEHTNAHPACCTTSKKSASIARVAP